jgi:KDO2-lipid IV(A) lauroyltransferase
MINKIGPLLVTALFKFLAFLPLTLLQIIGYGAGWLVWILPGSYKQRAKENLAIAIPEANEDMLRASLISVGQLFMEMPYWHMRPNETELAKQVKCDGWDEFESALAQGKGLILLGPHAGNFESLGAIYTSRFPATVLFRPPRIQWLQDWIIKTRTRKNLTMAPANHTGVRSLVKALKRGQTIGILPDQVPVLGEGVWAPFFGKPAYTTTLVQRLQSLTGAPIFVMAAERNGIGKGYTVRYQPLPEPLSSDIEIAATQLNQAMESMIQSMPTQYLWGYNRYRQPRTKPANTKTQKSNA